MKEWDVAKFVLMTSLLLCLVGMGMYMYQTYDLNNMRKDKPACQRLLTEVGRLSAEVELRKNELMNDKRQGERLNRYIEKQARQAGINYSRYLTLKSRGENKNNPQGYVDNPVELKPSGKKKFSRRQLASFIFNIENFTNRLKVTELYLDKPTLDREQWDMYMIITERAPLEKR
jgi:hypothetical protein